MSKSESPLLKSQYDVLCLYLVSISAREHCTVAAASRTAWAEPGFLHFFVSKPQTTGEQVFKNKGSAPSARGEPRILSWAITIGARLPAYFWSDGQQRRTKELGRVPDAEILSETPDNGRDLCCVQA